MHCKFAIGKTGSGNIEFGEVYHVGAAMVFSDGVQVDVVGEDYEIQHLFEFLSGLVDDQGRVKTIKREKYDQDKGKTRYAELLDSTTIVFKHYSEKHNELKKAFLKGRVELEDDIRDFLSKKSIQLDGKKVLIWIRNIIKNKEEVGEEQNKNRNMTLTGVEQLKKIMRGLDLTPILIGDSLCGHYKASSSNLIEFWKDKQAFKIGKKAIRRQLVMLELLREDFNVIAAVGMKSGSLDGPAFLGMPTIWFAEPNKKNDRIAKLGEVMKKFKLIEINGNFKQFSDTHRRKIRNELGKFMNSDDE